MKAMVVIIIIILLAIGYVMFQGGSKPPKPTRTQKRQQTTTEQTAQTGSQHPKAKSSISEDVDSVLGYGTGYTQMKVKKRQKSKLNKLSGEHNKALEAAAGK